MTNQAIETTRPKLTVVRRITATNGSHVRWRGSKKWRGNATAGTGLSDEALLALFVSEGWDVEDAVVEWGEIHPCPRCDGRGIYSGGACFRCYGSSPFEWHGKPITAIAAAEFLGRSQ